MEAGPYVLSPFEGSYDEGQIGDQPLLEGENGHGGVAPDFDHFEPQSPFLAEFMVGDQVHTHDAASEAFVGFLHELHDDEFDETLYELVAEATEVARGYESYEQDAGPLGRQHVERMLEQHFAPLSQEIESFFTRVAHEMDARHAEEMSEREFDELLESLVPETDHLAPTFDEFFKKLWKKGKKAAKSAWKKVKKVAKGVVDKAKQFALKALWPKLKSVARSLLKRVLLYALEKIPGKYRPLARTLAQRLGLLKGGDAGSGDCAQHESFFSMQDEFDTLVAGAVESEDEAAFEFALGEFENPMSDSESIDLAGARERFVHQMQELEPGQDPAPVVEEFAQAVLMAARLGIRLVGRPKVVSFLAKYLARIIKKWVGGSMAKPLSRVLVDAGMRLLKLEVQPEDEDEAAQYAIAAFVEDTVRAVSELPEGALRSEALIEGHVLEAMEQSASANLPQMLSERAYRKAPRLRESTRMRGTWIMLPLRARRRYKKFTRTPRVRISPHLAGEVTSFGGQPLDAFLRDRGGVDVGEEIEGTMHLYEVVAGGDAADIVRGESDVPGLGGAYGSWSRLHPLTPTVAGLLLQEPGLGRTVETGYLEDPRHLRPGQRVYFLEIPGAYTVSGASADGDRVVPQSTDASATIDFPNREVRVALYLGEPEAQEFLGKIVKGAGVRGLHAMGGVLRKRLKKAIRRVGGRGLRIIRGGRLPSHRCRAALETELPVPTQERFVDQLTDWTTGALARELSGRTHELEEALAHNADGVTVTATVHAPPGLMELEAAIEGRGARFPVDWVAGAEPEVSLRIESGRGEEAR